MPGTPAPAPRSSQPAPARSSQLRHVEQRERVAEERADDLGAGAQRGDVAAPPGEHQVRIARQGRGLGLFEAERRGQLFDRRVRVPAAGARRHAAPAARRSAATNVSTSSGVVCHEHIQRTTPVCSSHV